MTNEEFKTALIHIKRHIYSRPIKKYIDNLLKAHFMTVQSDCIYAARLYQVTYSLPLYAQEKGVYYDIKS